MVNDAEEKAKLQFEMQLIGRVKFEEEERKKKVEEEEDSKFDYLTLIVNQSKKHGSIQSKKGTQNSIPMTFKHSMTKKSIASAGLQKQ